MSFFRPEPHNPQLAHCTLEPGTACSMHAYLQTMSYEIKRLESLEAIKLEGM